MQYTRTLLVRALLPLLMHDVTTAANCAKLFPRTAADVSGLSSDCVSQATSTLAGISGMDPSARTWSNTAMAADRCETEFQVAHNLLSVVKHTHQEGAVRDASAEGYVALEKYSIDAFRSNKQLFEALSHFAKDPAAVQALPADQQYWLQEALREFRRNGLGLPDEKYDKVVALNKTIAELQTKFETNLSDDATALTFTAEELHGTPDTVMDSLTKEKANINGKDVEVYTCKMDYPTYFGVMQNCVVAATRKAMADAFDARASPVNLAVLHEVIALRHELAETLGFESYTAFDVDNKMVQTEATAASFISELIPKLNKKWEMERALLIQHRHASVELSSSGELMYYDVAFCLNQYKKTHLNVSETDIQEYFPMDATVDALFKIYEAFFGIEFRRVDDKLWWADEVFALAVYKRPAKQGEEAKLLGHVIMDLFPRDGKYTHACCHPVVPSTVDPKTGEQTPALTVVLANFPKPSGEKPALFKHDDVETFFHEFGHAIHFIFGRCSMSTHAGFNVKMDFVELPSQMLEEWLWESSILKQVSKHYKTGQPLPDELIQAKVDSKTAFSGRDSLRQLQFARMSLEFFSKAFAGAEKKTVKTAEGASKPFYPTAEKILALQSEVMPGIRYKQDPKFECNFGHLMGYGAGYYGYMWSEVLAQDVFNHIKVNDGLLSATWGEKYVDSIIGVGGSQDPNDMLVRFLGRKPTPDAFFSKLGLK